MKKLIAIISLSITIIASAVAQGTISTPVGGGGGGGANQNPIVPIEVAVKGRQAVTDYLVKQVDHVTVNYGGASVVAPWQNNNYLSADQLAKMGYVKGSFASLSDAIATQQFTASVMPTPDGQYIVSVSIVMYSIDNAGVFSGMGYLPIAQQKGGILWVGEFNPFVTLNDQITVKVSGQINAAMWVGPGWDNKSQLVITADSGGSSIILPTKYLEYGYLAVADANGNAQAIDLKSGTVIPGTKIFAMMGQTTAGDVRVLRDPQTINLVNWSFYKNNGQIFGRIPLTEIVIRGNGQVNFNFGVKVWGTDQVIVPQIFVSSVDGKLPEYEVPASYQGQFSSAFDPGVYHVRLVFNGVLDWTQNPNPDKG